MRVRASAFTLKPPWIQTRIIVDTHLRATPEARQGCASSGSGPAGGLVALDVSHVTSLARQGRPRHVRFGTCRVDCRPAWSRPSQYVFSANVSRSFTG